MEGFTEEAVLTITDVERKATPTGRCSVTKDAKARTVSSEESFLDGPEQCWKVGAGLRGG